MIDQLSVFVENRNGAIMEVTGILGEAGIDLRAMSIAESRDFGVARLLVSNPQSARQVLRAKGLTATITGVVAVEIEDKPGAFHRILTALYKAEIIIEYTYAFVSPVSGRAYAILRVQEEEKAEAALRDAGLNLLEKLEA